MNRYLVGWGCLLLGYGTLLLLIRLITTHNYFHWFPLVAALVTILWGYYLIHKSKQSHAQ